MKKIDRENIDHLKAPVLAMLHPIHTILGYSQRGLPGLGQLLFTLPLKTERPTRFEIAHAE